MIKKGEQMKKYKCPFCGYVYDPEKGDEKHAIPAGCDFDDLPDNWRCPSCGAEKSYFYPLEEEEEK